MSLIVILPLKLLSCGIGLLALACSINAYSTELNGVFSLTSDSSIVTNHENDNDFTHRALLDIGVEASWSEQWSGFANAQMQRGRNGSEVSGDIQGYSNVDADDYARLAEYWLHYQQDQWRFKFGQVDVNGEFAYVDNGGEFINNSMGFSPTLFVLPTFPVAAWGAMAFYRPVEHMELGFAVSAADGQHDFSEQFYIANWRTEFTSAALELGYWHQTGSFDTIDGELTQSGSNGWFVTLNGEFDGNLGYFIQAGTADTGVFEIERHIGAGIHYKQPWGRENDSLGLGITRANLSPDFGSSLSAETTIEAFYLWQVSDNFSIKPDIQWIADPSGESVSRNPVVFTLRLNIWY